MYGIRDRSACSQRMSFAPDIIEKMEEFLHLLVTQKRLQFKQNLTRSLHVDRGKTKSLGEAVGQADGASRKIQICLFKTKHSGPIVMSRYLFTELFQLGHDGIGCLIERAFCC